MGARSAQSGQTNGTVTTTRPLRYRTRGAACRNPSTCPELNSTERHSPNIFERKAGDNPAWSTPHPGWSALCALIGHCDGKRDRRGP